VLKGKIFAIGFAQEINDSSGSSKNGTAKSPGQGLCSSSKFFRHNNICMSAVVGSQCGATTGAAKGLKA
jgi:hypothetical protein